MESKDIKTLEDLRRAKRELKLKINHQNQSIQDNMLFSTVNSLVGGVQKVSSLQANPLGSSVTNTLNFISDRAEQRFNLGKNAKTILSVAVLIAAPIIAEKLQDVINKKA